MPPIVTKALAHEDFVEICYDGNHTDFIYTEPIGRWTRLDFDGDKCDYVSFLDCMVYKNVDVHRKMATLLLDEILDNSLHVNQIQLLNAMSILDPTFTPPWINVHCVWQQELMETIINKTFHVINTCYNQKRLSRYVSVLQSLAKL
jgi:hypothetical protein